ncbi:MAG: (2Fe-2S)-binding protein [Rhodothermaceae bacterium]|nr:(2Fe-2S)-binding protein [Rhodothermaceae bacterium]MXW33669.1 (2Fe-2S)-binding protein [Rhodothermaceae bacterium]MXZ16853.1 (2Fe-2S)-binding protein [Rhodothermaceae bacterium]MYC03186.1 (2Fe-2S)-binding protein [Rhodothermaceae bacterium]MYE62837.1 (2Fe-2S)-binding protein [Rhodothermaceae bacterium]
MPKITIPGHGAMEVEHGQRLVNALQANGVNLGHRCGGYARCTTCRVEFIAGEPEVISRAEQEKLVEGKLLGEVRLSCQILVEEDMTVKPLMMVEEMGWSDPGPPPEETVTPIPDWIEHSPEGA